MAWIAPGISFFLCWWTPPLQPRMVGPFPSMGCMVPKPFTTGGNRPYLEFWVVILAENPDGSMPAHTKGHEGNLPVRAHI
jgi:hypothetical protein